MRIDARVISVVIACVVLPLVAGGAQSDTIAEIRVHGNHTTPDAEVRALVGLEVGEPATDARLREAERHLRASGRFAAVEVRRRLRSIADPSDVLVIVLVSEHAAIREGDLMPGPAARIRHAAMWLPILSHADGYGFTYGARVSFVDALGGRSRVSVPLTWGGERRAAVELDRSFDGPITRARGTLAVGRRVNPHFDLPDTRQEVGASVERAWTPWLRTGAATRIARVAFGADEATHTASGVQVTLDTRLDPSFPRNAVHATAGWERLTFGAPPGRAGRWIADLRGYVGIRGSAVLALRGQLSRSDAPLPPAEQALLGGSDSVRGYRAGHRAGDSTAAVSAEVRLPLHSPLRARRFGVKAFVDAGTAWTAGGRLTNQRFERGIGGGIYAGAAAVLVDLDVAWPEAGRPRAHVGLGVSF